MKKSEKWSGYLAECSISSVKSSCGVLTGPAQDRKEMHNVTYPSEGK